MASICTSCEGASSGKRVSTSISSIDSDNRSRSCHFSKTPEAISTQRASRSQPEIRWTSWSISWFCTRSCDANSLQRRPPRVSCCTSSRSCSRLLIRSCSLKASASPRFTSFPINSSRPSLNDRNTSTRETRSRPLESLYSSSAAAVSSRVLSSCSSRIPIANTLVKMDSSICPKRLLSRCCPWLRPSCPVTDNWPVAPVSVS